jgi:hypothetical protein
MIHYRDADDALDAIRERFRAGLGATIRAVGPLPTEPECVARKTYLRPVGRPRGPEKPIKPKRVRRLRDVGTMSEGYESRKDELCKHPNGWQANGKRSGRQRAICKLCGRTRWAEAGEP